jgi:FlaA1/EpsC-like NDP-sugar epimerase
LIDGKISIKTVREISFEDLAVRDEVKLDQEEIARYLRQKRVLVTGAGGSVGSELIRQICRFRPLAVGLVEMNEMNLYRMEMECLQRFAYVKTYNYLVDIRRKEALDRTFREFQPDVVFHAAAYKHVPIQERYPWEAVYNNVIGTRNLVEASLEAGVGRFVLVSSDKAVRPTNVMGATKRVAEMMVEGRNGNAKTRFMAVRFGNVMGSSGSVIPLFQEQIARGGPVTVTHPDMIRYFMSIPEAAQLILQAGAMGKGGEVFILDMGKPIRILDMARDLIRLHGFEPETDIPIQFIGLRPGEKLHEELITAEEGIVSTTHKKIMVLRGNHTWDPVTLNGHIDALLAVTREYDGPSIKRKLQELIPDYAPQI